MERFPITDINLKSWFHTFSHMSFFPNMFWKVSLDSQENTFPEVTFF